MAIKKPKLVILISGRGSNMAAIIDAIATHQLNASIEAVISNKTDAKGLQTAQQAGIATVTIEHQGFDSREAFDSALIKEIDKYQPDLVVLAGFMRILSEHFVNYYAKRLINIHPSLLPKFKGLNTHQRVLDAGESKHGATVHMVTAELDDGPIVLQAEVDVLPDDDADSLAARVLEQEHQLYPNAIKLLFKQ